MVRRFFFIIVSLLSYSAAALPDTPTQTTLFTTWRIFEPDKAASIWMIKRHINADAQFGIYPAQSQIETGISFDIPTSEFRRTHRSSAYEMLRKHYAIEDATVHRIGAYIHDIEINTWRKKRFVESSFILAQFANLDLDQASDEVFVACSISIFDQISTLIKSDKDIETFDILKTNCPPTSSAQSPS